jgi:hypothetical protein
MTTESISAILALLVFAVLVFLLIRADRGRG